MVAPIIAAIGAIGVLGMGVIGFLIADIVMYWGSLAAGFGFAAYTLRYLIMEDPVPVLDDGQANNILYLLFSLVTGLVAFKALQAVGLAFGFLAVLVVGALALASWVLGIGVVTSALSSLVFFLIEVFDEVSQ